MIKIKSVWTPFRVRKQPHPETHIETDGVTVWVHRGGETIARFGRFGIDIHRPMAEQAQGLPQCLACTHTTTTVEDWVRFVELMQRHHGVTIEEEFRPTRFSQTKTQPD